MNKKTLEEKIKLVCWWALGLTILYFVIGACLISDGSKFDPTKTYNLLKDTLTLTAAFLAPVAAFVLFSDWRAQHVDIKVERTSESIYVDLDAVSNDLFKIFSFIIVDRDSDQFHGLHGQISKKISKINLDIITLGLSKNFHDLNFLNKFCTCANDLAKELDVVSVEYLGYHQEYLNKLSTFADKMDRTNLEDHIHENAINTLNRHTNTIVMKQDLLDLLSKLKI